jgi:hypothetical protein
MRRVYAGTGLPDGYPNSATNPLAAADAHASSDITADCLAAADTDAHPDADAAADCLATADADAHVDADSAADR